MVRFSSPGEPRNIAPGIIVKVIRSEAPPTFQVLSQGESWVVTHRDLGPFSDLSRQVTP